MGSLTISLATTVEVFQGLAAIAAVASAAYSFYLAFTHKGKRSGKKARRKGR